MATTPNRGYQLPAPGSKLKDDVLRLIAAFGAIDTDVANLLLALADKSNVGHGHAMAEIAGLVAALGNKLDVGYHDALANLTDVDVAGVANGMALLRQASKWIPVALQINNIAGLETALNGKATPADITAAINALVAAAPGTLDTLNELATALGNDPDFATTITNSLAGKQPLDSDLTAIAALTTTAFGRGLLTAVNAAAFRDSISAPGIVRVASFAASATYVPHSKMLFCLIEAVGGGGGGGGAGGVGGSGIWIGGGGGGGAYSSGYFSRADVGASQSIIIGAGGGAGGNGPGHGAPGGGTSVGTLVGAAGGQGGIASNSSNAANGGYGGSTGAGTGQIKLAGFHGSPGSYGAQGVTGAGGGAISRFGGGGRAVLPSATGGTVAGEGGALGGGGSGGAANATGAGAAGGAGGAGYVQITEFCSE